MAPKLWAPDALWVLPPSPYENHTPKADGFEKAKWALLGATLFLPRLLLALLTSACARQRRTRAGGLQRARQQGGGALTRAERSPVLRSRRRLDHRAGLHRRMASRLEAAGT
jgi:hypothetical protein